MDKYKEVKLLGRGASGTAYLYKREADGKSFVIKQINSMSMDKSDREEALNEVSVLSKVDHPNIVRMEEYFDENGLLCIVMEYCEGGDLNSLLKRRKQRAFPEPQIIHWFLQICLAVKHLHSRKILHRDLKLSNVFLTHKRRIVKLGDFGIAKTLGTSSAFTLTSVGTPYYLSPEICSNQPYDTKSDIWALGCLLYELITHRHAFQARSIPALVVKIMKGTYPTIPPSLASQDLRDLVARMLCLDPTERPTIYEIIQSDVIQNEIHSLHIKKSGKNRKIDLSATQAVLQGIAEMEYSNTERMVQELKLEEPKPEMSWQERMMAQLNDLEGALGKEKTQLSDSRTRDSHLSLSIKSTTKPDSPQDPPETSPTPTNASSTIFNGTSSSSQQTEEDERREVDDLIEVLKGGEDNETDMNDTAGDEEMSGEDGFPDGTFVILPSDDENELTGHDGLVQSILEAQKDLQAQKMQENAHTSNEQHKNATKSEETTPEHQTTISPEPHSRGHSSNRKGRTGEKKTIFAESSSERPKTSVSKLNKISPIRHTNGEETSSRGNSPGISPTTSTRADGTDRKGEREGEEKEGKGRVTLRLSLLSHPLRKQVAVRPKTATGLRERNAAGATDSTSSNRPLRTRMMDGIKKNEKLLEKMEGGKVGGRTSGQSTTSRDNSGPNTSRHRPSNIAQPRPSGVSRDPATIRGRTPPTGTEAKVMGRKPGTRPTSREASSEGDKGMRERGKEEVRGRKEQSSRSLNSTASTRNTTSSRQHFSHRVVDPAALSKLKEDKKRKEEEQKKAAEERREFLRGMKNVRSKIKGKPKEWIEKERERFEAMKEKEEEQMKQYTWREEQAAMERADSNVLTLRKRREGQGMEKEDNDAGLIRRKENEEKESTEREQMEREEESGKAFRHEEEEQKRKDEERRMIEEEIANIQREEDRRKDEARRKAEEEEAHRQEQLGEEKRLEEAWLFAQEEDQQRMAAEEEEMREQAKLLEEMKQAMSEQAALKAANEGHDKTVPSQHEEATEEHGTNTEEIVNQKEDDEQQNEPDPPQKEEEEEEKEEKPVAEHESASEPPPVLSLPSTEPPPEATPCSTSEQTDQINHPSDSQNVEEGDSTG